MTIDEQIEVMQHFKDGGEVEFKIKGLDTWKKITEPVWNFDKINYRKKEYTYPMWFKSKRRQHIVRFDSPESGEVVDSGNSEYPKGYSSNNWFSHIDKTTWEQVEEPKEAIYTYEYYKMLSNGLVVVHRCTEEYAKINLDETYVRIESTKLEWKE